MNRRENVPVPVAQSWRIAMRDWQLVALGAIWSICLAVVGAVAYQVHPHALTGFAYYLGAWTLFILLFDRRETKGFVTAYLVNAALTALYVLLQVHFYPDSHGCTSPLGAQTDDSFFFSLVADKIPDGIDTRKGFYLYNYGFATLVRLVTPFQILHPLDVLFFLSGVAGIVCVYTRQLAVQLTGSIRAGRTAYLLALFCPMMLMNGGAVFVRDTLVAGVLVLSFCCLNRRRYLAFTSCVVLQFLMRPGTALMILVLYGFIFAENIGGILRRKANRLRVVCAFALLALVGAAGYVERDWIEHQFERNGVVLGELRREGQEEALAGGFGKGTFTVIQQQVLPVRLALSTAYMYLAPFFSFNSLLTPDGFDTRILLMNVVYPFWVIPVHAWIFAAWFARPGFRSTLRKWILMVLVACFLIGTVSLQSRHRVVIQPLFYAIAAAGCHLGGTASRLVGFGLAGLWFVAQLAYQFLF